MCAGPSLDHLISPLQERRRDRQTEGLGGLQVDDQLVLRRPLDGKVTGLRTLQDLVHIDGGATIERQRVRPVGQKASRLRELPLLIYGGQAVLRGNLDEVPSVSGEDRGREHDQTI